MRLEDEISQKKFKNEYQKAIINIMFTESWINDKSKSSFTQFDITKQQYNVLRILRGQHPNSANINLLKKRMIDKASDASRLVDRLLKKKLIVKKKNQQDKRNSDIYISNEGLELLSAMDEDANKMDDLLSNLNEEEVKQLNFLLDKIRD